jgi:lysozyme
MKYEKAIALIKDYEKCRLKAYLCQAGVPTIGWGTTVYCSGHKVKLGDEITQEQADNEFLWHFEDMTDRVRALLKFPDLLSENQMGAILSLVYNIGIGAFEDSTLRFKLNRFSPLVIKDSVILDSIAEEFKRWNKVKGKESAGLTRRRKEEMELFLV